jgi:hypothetical protein
MDFGTSREGEDEIYALTQEGVAGDGSKFLNDSGEGMEEERPHKTQTSVDCKDGSQEIGLALTKSCEVY